MWHSEMEAIEGHFEKPIERLYWRTEAKLEFEGSKKPFLYFWFNEGVKKKQNTISKFQSVVKFLTGNSPSALTLLSD